MTENKWKLVAFIKPEDCSQLVLEVVWSNEIGLQQTDRCMAIFETTSEYKLVAPWLGVGKILLKSNISDIQFNKIEKENGK